MLIAYAAIGAAVLLLSTLATPLLHLYGQSGEISALARQLLLYHGIVSIVIWPIGFCLPPTFRAANDVRFTMVVSTLSMWVFRVALGYVMALEQVSVFGLFSLPGLGLGVFGVWLAMTVDWLFRATLFGWRFFSGKWLCRFDAMRQKKTEVI